MVAAQGAEPPAAAASAPLLTQPAGAMPADAAAAQATLKAYYFDAARSGNRAMLEAFIAARYPMNTADEKGYTALILAAYHGHRAYVQRLMEAGADPCAEDQRGNTALMGAIFRGEVEVARLLVGAACNPNHRNAAGQTPAMYAALFGRIETLQALKSKGADLTLTDGDGNSATSLQQGQGRLAR